MVYISSTHVNAGLLAATVPKSLNVSDPASIQDVAKILAAGAMSYYPGNAEQYADLPNPYYWWETAGLFGAMLDYSHYTKDTSYDEVISTALLAQVGPNFDFMLPAHFGDEGNDDQSFWGFAVLAAAERNFTQPDPSIPSWLDLGQNLWNSMASRWDTSTCGGGLQWQIFASNPNGLHYKNSIANGGLFQLSARLARITGNQTYLDWANKVWDWSTGIGLVDQDYNVYDGSQSPSNCSSINPISFTYTEGVYLYGASVLANYTSDTVWEERSHGLLQAASGFFSPFPNATNVMYERACETVDMCDTDMQSFKGYLSRFMFQSTLMLPSLAPNVTTLLQASAQAAADACTGGDDGTVCGQKWYVGGFDGTTGLGEEMCALETVQGLLVALNGPDAQSVRQSPNATATSDPEASASPSKKSISPGGKAVDIRAAVLSVATAVVWWSR